MTSLAGKIGADREKTIEQIYLAGARPAGWLPLLEQISRLVGARGANLIRATSEGIQMHSTPQVRDATLRFQDEGWGAVNSRVTRLFERMPYAGFLADSHIHSAEEIGSLPIYTEFLAPLGLSAGAATIVQGAAHDRVMLAFEGFAGHPASRAGCKALDSLRPHLARALVLSQEVEQMQARTVLEGFEAMGLAVGLLSSDAGLIIANARFHEASEGILRCRGKMLEAVSLRARFGLELALQRACNQGAGDSIALHTADGQPGAVLHLVPYVAQESGVFSKIAAFALLAQTSSDALPRSDIIAALFDLTPAEATVARTIAQGKPPADVAATLGLSVETVRTHLKRVFAKTGVNRQSELVALLSRFQ